jgi:hypothetical protein
VARPRCSNAAGAVTEGACEPWREGSPGAWDELQAGPKRLPSAAVLPLCAWRGGKSFPCEGASHGFEVEDCLKGASGFEAGFKVAEMGAGHASRGEIVPEFLQHDFAGDRGRVSRALQTDKSGVLERASAYEGCQVTKVAGCEDGDMVVDAEMHGCERENTAPTGENDSFGFFMVRPGVKPCRYAEGESFEMAAANAQSGAVPEHENVRARMRLAGPETLTCTELGADVWGTGRLPLAELLAEGAYAVGLLGGCGVVAPEGDKGFAGVFGALHGGPIGQCAAMGARGFC